MAWQCGRQAINGTGAVVTCVIGGCPRHLSATIPISSSPRSLARTGIWLASVTVES